jgi:DNA-binding transcriptional LysR family regulator
MHGSILRYLEQVVRLGSIRKAAQVLNVASTAVNRKILKLEQELGAPIFERRRDGVRLTASGELLLRHVRATLNDYKRTLSEIAAHSGAIQGEVKLLTVRVMIDQFVGGVISDINALHPAITFRITGFDPTEAGERVEPTAYDLSIVFTGEGGSGQAILAQIKTSVGLILPPTHPLAKKKKVSLADCSEMPMLSLDDLWFGREVSRTRFAKNGGKLHFQLVANSLPLVKRSIKSGMGIGVFSPIAYLDDLDAGTLVFRPLSEQRFGKSEIGLTAPRQHPLSIPAQIFADLMIKRFAEIQRRVDRYTGRG